MSNMKDARYPGWDKYQYTVKSETGKKSVVHYVKNPKTGERADFKFNKRSDGSYYTKDPTTGNVIEHNVNTIRK